jgi:hypothetical protein
MTEWRHQERCAMTTLVFCLVLILTTAYDPCVLFGLDSAPASQVGEPADSADPNSISVWIQRDHFIPVEGADFKSKMEAALKRARATDPAKSFWTAYSFDVRPGVAVDAETIGNDGSRTFVQGSSVSFGGQAETRNLGIFLLREPGNGSITRIEVYNLERTHEYGGLPVYWIGHVTTNDSLPFLNDLIELNQTSRVGEHGIMALALHDDPRVGPMLEKTVEHSAVQKNRSQAVFWLGQIGGEQPFLINLVQSEQESVEVRKQAAFAIGVGKDDNAIGALESLYDSVNPREVKRQIIFAVSINRSSDSAVNFLIRVAGTDPDREMRKQAIFWLGQKAGQKGMEALGNMVESDPDTEVQKQAVFAISRRPEDEAVPLLIKIAKTHPKGEVRKQAIFWLGQIGDQRVLDFFKEILSK